MDVGAFVETVAASDRSIRSWQLHAKTFLDDQIVADRDWGYDEGWEYTSGSEYMKFPNEPEHRRNTVSWTCDGEEIVGFREQRAPTGGRAITGVIREANPADFKGTPNAGTLLGHDLNYSGRLRFGEALLACPNVRMRKSPQFVRGRACRLLDLKEADCWDDDRFFDARVWIDPDRDHRVMRLEKHLIFSGKPGWRPLLQLLGRRKFHERVEVTRLEQIAGRWLPVAGTVRSGKRVYRVEIDPASVRINQPIPKSRFVVSFPADCKVFDYRNVPVKDPGKRTDRCDGTPWPKSG